MKIRKDDKVLIISGKDRGRTGKVLKTFPQENRLVVEGINMVKKHVRPRKSGEKGQIVQMPAPINASNIKLICKNCSKPTRIGYKIISQEKSKKSLKIRTCKKCGKET